MKQMVVVWLVTAVVFVVIETITTGLISIWFVGGALAALAAAAFGNVPLQGQLALFCAVSGLLLAATRPLARRLREKAVPTNLDRVLHQVARVTETVDNERSVGAVYIDGKTWTARSEDEVVLAKDTMVEVVRMDGVKLFVREKKQED